MVVKATRGECVVLEVTLGRPGGGSLGVWESESLGWLVHLAVEAGGMLTVTG